MKILAQLDNVCRESELPYGVFGGTLIRVYDKSRQTSDIDVLTVSNALPVIATAFDTEVTKDKYGQDVVVISNLEVVSDLEIRTPVGICKFGIDDLMITHLHQVILDGIEFSGLSHEDHIVLKAILQRDENIQKNDIRDIQVLASFGELNMPYIRERIRRADATGWADNFLLRLNVLDDETNGESS